MLHAAAGPAPTHRVSVGVAPSRGAALASPKAAPVSAAAMRVWLGSATGLLRPAQEVATGGAAAWVRRGCFAGVGGHASNGRVRHATSVSVRWACPNPAQWEAF